jgi:hypothetical protein
MHEAAQGGRSWVLPRRRPRTRDDCFRDPDTSRRTVPVLTWLSRSRRRPCYRNATASVVSPQPADGCFTPAMHKPSRSEAGGIRPAIAFSAASADPPARSDRPALAVRVIGLRGKQSRDVSGADDRIDQRRLSAGVIGLPRERSSRCGAWRDWFRRRGITRPVIGLREERSRRPGCRRDRSRRHGTTRRVIGFAKRVVGPRPRFRSRSGP